MKSKSLRASSTPTWSSTMVWKCTRSDVEKERGEGGGELGTQNFIIRKRKGEGEGERTRNSELYYSRIEILGSSLFLQSVLAKLHRQHI